VRAGDWLTSGSDTARNEFVYINLVSNILLEHHNLNKYYDASSTTFPLPAEHLPSISLHSTASWYMYTLLEDNRSHASFSIGFGHELCMIFSNTKDEAWSQHEHLHTQENFKSTREYLSYHKIWILQKWWAVVTSRYQWQVGTPWALWREKKAGGKIHQQS